MQPEFAPATWEAFRRFALDGISASQVAAELGLSRRVVLPFSRARFRSTSVTDRGDEWGRRFDTIVADLDKEDIIELDLEGSDDEAYAATNVRILDEAAAMATNCAYWSG